MHHHIPEALNVIDLLMCQICQVSLSDFMSNASVQAVSQPDALCRQRAHDTRRQCVHPGHSTQASWVNDELPQTRPSCGRRWSIDPDDLDGLQMSLPPVSQSWFTSLIVLPLSPSSLLPCIHFGICVIVKANDYKTNPSCAHGVINGHCQSWRNISAATYHGLCRVRAPETGWHTVQTCSATRWGDLLPGTHMSEISCFPLGQTRFNCDCTHISETWRIPATW